MQAFQCFLLSLIGMVLCGIYAQLKEINQNTKK